MPSLNLRNVLRRNPARPSLRERAAALKASAAKAIRGPKPETAADAAPAETWILLDTALVSKVRELVAIEAEQGAILKAGDYADAFDAPDWVRLERTREAILARVIATRAHTTAGLKAKASLFDLESVRALDQPSRDLSRSIVADVAAFDVMSQPDQRPASPAVGHVDPHLALLPALRQAFAWTRDAHPISERGNFGSPEHRASTAVFQHWWSVADRILALPAPQTPAGLGAVALALSAWSEGSVGRDPETCHEERRTASAIRAMMSISGTTHFPEWTGFGDEPDSETRWSAMMERAGEGSLPAWALGGKTGPNAEDTTSEGAPEAAHVVEEPAASPPALDLSECSIPQIARLYEVFHAAYDHLSALGQLPCFSTDSNLNAAGGIIDREADRLARFFSACAEEIARHAPTARHERDDALATRLMHEIACNGRIHDPALMRDIATAWGA